MDLRFYTDPESNEPHIYYHEVSEPEVEDVLTRPLRIAQEEKARVSRSGKPERDVTFGWSTCPQPPKRVYS